MKKRKRIKARVKTVRRARLHMKMNICRSYTRKINLGNFETLDVFASIAEEIPTSDTKTIHKVSRKLFEIVRKEVLEDVGIITSKREEPLELETNTIPKELRELADELADNARHGVSSSIADYQRIIEYPELRIQINNAKKAFKRENKDNPNAYKKVKKSLSRVEKLKEKIKNGS